MAYPEIDNTEPSLYDVLRQIGKGMINRSHWNELGQGMGRAGRAMPSVAESLGRGAVASIPGTLGDVEGLGRMIAGNENPTMLPTTDDILARLPRMSQASPGADSLEMMGGILSPTLGRAGKVAKSPLNQLRRLEQLRQ